MFFQVLMVVVVKQHRQGRNQSFLVELNLPKIMRTLNHSNTSAKYVHLKQNV